MRFTLVRDAICELLASERDNQITLLKEQGFSNIKTKQLNGNITINFYFKTFDEVIEQIFENNNNRFNITSQITNLDNGHYSHKLSRPINLTNSKIVNANFLTNGSIYNLSTDQTVTIDGIPFIVQKGCYTLEEILSGKTNIKNTTNKTMIITIAAIKIIFSTSIILKIVI